jgi:single-strand DNA-binding protein
VKFSVATKKSWKDDSGEWKEKSQWHNVVAFGPGFQQLAARLDEGTHVFVQGELTTREYDRTIKIANGEKPIEHVIQQLVVELKADTIRVLDRDDNSEPSEATRTVTEGDVPFRGTRSLMTKLWFIRHQRFAVDCRDDGSSGPGHSFFLAPAFVPG